MNDRDHIWVDMTQFDNAAADGVWDGTSLDDEAPGWYGHMRSLVLRARGPAEPDELVDEHEVVERMRRATLGEVVARTPQPSRRSRRHSPNRPPGARTLGRVLAMKAAAMATVATMVSVAAAATTGIVVTMAATVVVPAVNDRVGPMIERHDAPEPVAPPSTTPRRATPGPKACAHDPGTCPTRRQSPVATDEVGPSRSPAGPGTSAAGASTGPPAPTDVTATSPSEPHPAPVPDELPASAPTPPAAGASTRESTTDAAPGRPTGSTTDAAPGRPTGSTTDAAPGRPTTTTSPPRPATSPPRPARPAHAPQPGAPPSVSTLAEPGPPPVADVRAAPRPTTGRAPISGRATDDRNERTSRRAR